MRLRVALRLRLLRLLRRESLVELLLRRIAGSVGPHHRLLLRIARLLLRRSAEGQSVFVDH